MIKTLNKVGLQGTSLNIIRAIYEKPTGHVILNEEKLRAFPLRSGIKQGFPLSNFIQHCTGSRSHNNQTIKTIGMQISKENKTSPICRGHDTISRRSDRFPQKTAKTHKFSKVAQYKTNVQKFVAFLYTNSEAVEKLRK